MGYVYTGYKRSLSVSVTKKINNIVQSGYPKTYPTATDISNGYFTWDSTTWDIPTADELAKLDTNAYNYLLSALKSYVESIEAGLDFNTDIVVEPVISDETTCPPGTPESTTTTTTEAASTTTTEAGTTTTTAAPISILVSNLSMDIVITAITVDTTSITVVSGALPLSQGNSLEATIPDSLIGLAIPITIEYTSTLSGQHISVDSASPPCYLSDAGTPATFTRDILASDTITIDAADGACA